MLQVRWGCNQTQAFNYDRDATVSDGSCVPVKLGCTDTGGVNYNPLANTVRSPSGVFGPYNFQEDCMYSPVHCLQVRLVGHFCAVADMLRRSV